MQKQEIYTTHNLKPISKQTVYLCSYIILTSLWFSLLAKCWLVSTATDKQTRSLVRAHFTCTYTFRHIPLYTRTTTPASKTFSVHLCRFSSEVEREGLVCLRHLTQQMTHILVTVCLKCVGVNGEVLQLLAVHIFYCKWQESISGTTSHVHYVWMRFVW